MSSFCHSPIDCWIDEDNQYSITLDIEGKNQANKKRVNERSKRFPFGQQPVKMCPRFCIRSSVMGQ